MLIYRCLNLENKKCYIGKTIFSLKKRMKQHISDMKKNKYKSIFHDALRKYGGESFSWDIIWEGDCSSTWLNELEKYYIYFFESFQSGYNMTEGGEGGALWTRERISKEKRIELGKKIADSRDNTYLKNGVFKTMTIEQRRKNLLKRDNSYLKGKNNPFCKLSREKRKETIEKGNVKRRLYKPTRETILKISKIIIERKCFVGRRNPMARKYKAISPTGRIFIVLDGIESFCNKMNLSAGMILRSIKSNKTLEYNRNVKSEKAKNTIGWRVIQCQ